MGFQSSPALPHSWLNCAAGSSAPGSMTGPPLPGGGGAAWSEGGGREGSAGGGGEGFAGGGGDSIGGTISGGGGLGLGSRGGWAGGEGGGGRGAGLAGLPGAFVQGPLMHTAAAQNAGDFPHQPCRPATERCGQFQLCGSLERAKRQHRGPSLEANRFGQLLPAHMLVAALGGILAGLAAVA